MPYKYTFDYYLLLLFSLATATADSLSLAADPAVSGRARHANVQSKLQRRGAAYCILCADMSQPPSHALARAPTRPTHAYTGLWHTHTCMHSHTATHARALPDGSQRHSRPRHRAGLMERSSMGMAGRSAARPRASRAERRCVRRNAAPPSRHGRARRRCKRAARRWRRRRRRRRRRSRSA